MHVFTMKKKDIAVLIVSITIAGIILTNVSSNNTILGTILESAQEPEWEELPPRNIVKNTIPITLLERNNECLVTAKLLDSILEQKEFTQPSK